MEGLLKYQLKLTERKWKIGIATTSSKSRANKRVMGAAAAAAAAATAAAAAAAAAASAASAASAAPLHSTISEFQFRFFPEQAV